MSDSTATTPGRRAIAAASARVASTLTTPAPTSSAPSRRVAVEPAFAAAWLSNVTSTGAAPARASAMGRKAAKHATRRASVTQRAHDTVRRAVTDARLPTLTRAPPAAVTAETLRRDAAGYGNCTRR